VYQFRYIYQWLERYFLNDRSSTNNKYAIAGYLSKHFHYRGLTFVKEKYATCYQMFPTEEAFFPEPFYFNFVSAVASSLQEGISRLRAGGFLHVIETSMDFRDNLMATYYSRPLVAKYRSEVTYEELQNNKLKENMISLGNIQSGLYVAMLLILAASVCFVSEVCILHQATITQKDKWQFLTRSVFNIFDALQRTILVILRQHKW